MGNEAIPISRTAQDEPPPSPGSEADGFDPQFGDPFANHVERHHDADDRRRHARGEGPPDRELQDEGCLAVANLVLQPEPKPRTQ